MSDDQIEAVSADTGTDFARPFVVDALDIRGRVVHLDHELGKILDRHGYPDVVARVLSEATTLTALLATTLKSIARFTLQTQSDGAVHMLVVDFTPPSALRAYVSYNENRLAEALKNGQGDSAALLGSGHLAMTVDLGGASTRHQGIVPLDTGGFEAAARHYFAQSEQIPTDVRLAVSEVLTPGGNRRWRAGGMMIQFLPNSPERLRQRDIDPGDAPSGARSADPFEEDDAWREAKALVETLDDHELTDPSVSADALIYRLFHEHDIRVFDPVDLRDQCRCSRERAEGMLSGLSADERDEMTVDNQISVTCEFCSAVYLFDPETLT